MNTKLSILFLASFFAFANVYSAADDHQVSNLQRRYKNMAVVVGGTCCMATAATVAFAASAVKATSSASCIGLSVGAGVCGCAACLITSATVCVVASSSRQRLNNTSDFHHREVVPAIVFQQVMTAAPSVEPTRTQTLQ